VHNSRNYGVLMFGRVVFRATEYRHFVRYQLR